MATFEGFRGMMADLAPPWMKGIGTWIQKFLWSLGVMIDAVMQWLVEGMTARHPSVGTPTAYQYLGRDRVIIRGFAEPDASYKVRLRQHIATRSIAGHPWSIVRSLKAYFTGFAVQIATVSDLTGTWYVSDANGVESIYWKQGNWNWQNAPSTEWARFWVIIWPKSSGVWAAESTWGAGGAGSTWGDGGQWGINGISADQAADIRAIIVGNMPQGTTCAWIIHALDPASFPPGGAAVPDGHWRAWGKEASPGSQVFISRLDTARYQDGSNPALVIQES